MFGIAGEHPLLRDAANAGLGTAHFAAKSCCGAHSFRLAYRLSRGPGNDSLLSPRKIVVVVMMMMVVRLLSAGTRCGRQSCGKTSLWDRFGLWIEKRIWV